MADAADRARPAGPWSDEEVARAAEAWRLATPQAKAGMLALVRALARQAADEDFEAEQQPQA